MFKLVMSVFLASVSSFVFAEGGPCHSDVQKLCGNVERGGGRIMKCLRENEAQLSPECKTQREAMKGARKEIHESCEDDVQSLCGGINPGEGRIIQCLKSKSDLVSADCKASWEAKKLLRKGKIK
jgi:hypothetical protein